MSFKRLRPYGVFCVAAWILTGVALAQSVPAVAHGVRNDLPQPYRTSRDWAQPPSGSPWAAVTAVEPSPDGSIYVIHRCLANSCAGRSEAPILKYDAGGKLLNSWGQGMFIFPHGATVDHSGNLWVTDSRGADGLGHQVFKFSAEGKVLMTLGKAGVSGSGTDLFDQPTDVVVAPNGELFVTDSHRNGKNNRVVKLTRDGKFIKQWGRKGSGPGELSEPHSIAMDSQGRLFVGDRENNRIQIFDQEGRHLAEWRQFGRPSGIYITADDTIYVADSESGPDTGAKELPGIKKGIRIGSAKDGSVHAFIEDMEPTTADHSGAEGVGVDAQGNVYGAVVRRQMLERHVPVKQAPMFEVDPFWPKPLPNHWVTGSTIGLSIDAQDRVWTIHRPNTIEDNFKAADLKVGDERGRDPEALPSKPGAAVTDTFIGKCCKVAPPVLVYDHAGNLVKSWGGPGKGYDWPESNHGISVDHQGHVWLAGNGDKDTQILKFDGDGKFLLQIGTHGVHHGSNDVGNFWKPTNASFDPASRDPQQTYIYAANGVDQKINILLRSTLEVLTSFGDGGRGPGQFFGIHNLATDSQGNLYTTETYTGARVQRFLYKGVGPVTKADQGVVWPNHQR